MLKLSCATNSSTLRFSPRESQSKLDVTIRSHLTITSRRRPLRTLHPLPSPRNYSFRQDTNLSRIYPGPKLKLNPLKSRIDFSAHKIPGAVRANLKADYYIPFRESKHELEIVKPVKFEYGRKMKCWFQILSTPTADTPGTTLMLHFDQKRYLIGNVGEGTQRATVQRKLGLTKVGDIFLTGPIGWDNAGGLLGMILTVADASAGSRENVEKSSEGKAKKAKDKKSKAGEPDKVWLNLHGGKNLTHLLATARRFIFRKGMPLHTNEFTTRNESKRENFEPSWQDDFIKVWSMVIDPEGRSHSPRKRSHDEFAAPTPLSTETNKKETLDEIEDRYDQMRQSVVSSMFGSNWKLDALVARKLSEVTLPAAIFVRTGEGKIAKYAGPMPAEGVEVPDVDVLVRNPWPGALIQELPPTSPSTSSVCYIIRNHPQRGKFDKNAAIKLGVKPGPNFSLLTRGQSITTESGSLVTPEMVMSPTKEGNGFAIVELPNVSYIKPLISREEWSSKELISGVEAIIWLLGPGVVKDKRLQDFMRKHNELKHIVSSKDCCPNYIALESPASAAIRLHLIDPDRFPIPKHNNTLEQPEEQFEAGEKPYETAKAGVVYNLEPRFQCQDELAIPILDTAAVVREAQENLEVMELAKKAQEEVSSPEYLLKLEERQKDIPSKDAEIVTLGTGSALPSKYRNVSANLLRVPGYGSYLLDCGENSLGQLKRVFGDEVSEVLRDLKAIWISHLHADHHLGTAAVIKAWAAETAKHDETKNNKLRIISHEGMTNWVKEYSEVEDISYARVETVTVAHSGQRNFKINHPLTPTQISETGIISIKACSVEHCHGAAAVVFGFPNGFKVAYSGDCRPSWDFVEIGQDATLLIHEATFDDELQGDAIAKKHSTTFEALDVGREMNARRILLTHFSQRYQKIPIMDSEGDKDQVAIVAFDYMRVKVGDFAKVDAFKPALMKLYEEEVAQLEENGKSR